LLVFCNLQSDHLQSESPDLKAIPGVEKEQGGCSFRIWRFGLQIARSQIAKKPEIKIPSVFAICDRAICHS